jgi:hypothetical protein
MGRSVTDDLEIRDRKLLLIATGDYADEQWGTLGVDSETKVWRDWLTADALGERHFTVVLEDLAHSPDQARLDELLRKTGIFHPRDVVVCYITGHGEIGKDDGQHWLALTNSTADDASTGLDTFRLVRWLRRDV